MIQFSTLRFVLFVSVLCHAYTYPTDMWRRNSLLQIRQDPYAPSDSFGSTENVDLMPSFISPGNPVWPRSLYDQSPWSRSPYEQSPFARSPYEQPLWARSPYQQSPMNMISPMRTFGPSMMGPALPSLLERSSSDVMPMWPGSPYDQPTQSDNSKENSSSPWQVTLTAHKSDRNLDSCGGALISNELVLTSAECLEDAEVVDVAFNGDPNYQFRQIETFTKSRKYRGIGLIKLPQPVKAAEGVQWIRLDMKPLSPGAVATLDLKSKRLKMRVLDDTRCKQSELGTGAKRCAIPSKGESVCAVKRGDPVVRKVGGVWRLVGVVSEEANEKCQCGASVVFVDWMRANYKR